MKRELLVSLCVLAMASVSFGEPITFDFEGSDPVGVVNGWGSSSVVEGYATSGTHSLMVEMGGWGIAFTFDDSAAIKNALATVGKITLDVTTANFPEGWGGMGVFLQGGGEEVDGYWDIYSWTGDGVLAVGTTQTLTFQISAEEMAKIAGSNWWFQAGIGINAPDAIPAVYDDITGELISPAVTPTWYFDNVQIVPEPATLGLLGLGALSLIRRKR